jgi:hypothetical protein
LITLRGRSGARVRDATNDQGQINKSAPYHSEGIELRGRQHRWIAVKIAYQRQIAIGLIQLEHRTPGVGVENGITPCRLSACSMSARHEKSPEY